MIKIALIVPFVAVVLVPFVTGAHERHIYEINGIQYQFVVGSINEPLYVEDKSGVEFTVERVSVLPGHEEHHHDVGPGAVTGLEESLKIELVAGERRKTLDVSAAWDADGKYTATFYPTEATELSYRIFGTLEGVPLDILFTCANSGHVTESEPDVTHKIVGAGVTRVSKAGSFSCPRDTRDAGFPGDIRPMAEIAGTEDTTRLIAILALLAGGFGSALSLFRRRT